jgi:hypothetical protein
MERSIGFEKTIQVAQFEPIKVSSYINDIPQEVWSNTDFIQQLYRLLIIESYQTVFDERVVKQQLSEGNPNEVLHQLKTEVLVNLNFQDIIKGTK